jgi:hypothetical protein
MVILQTWTVITFDCIFAGGCQWAVSEEKSYRLLNCEQLNVGRLIFRDWQMILWYRMSEAVFLSCFLLYLFIFVQ